MDRKLLEMIKADDFKMLIVLAEVQRALGVPVDVSKVFIFSQRLKKRAVSIHVLLLPFKVHALFILIFS